MKNSFSFLLLVFILPLPLFSGKPQLPDLEEKPILTSQRDPNIDQYWYLNKIGAQKVWPITLGNPNITIAVIDSGIAYNHPELAPNIKRKSIEWPFNFKDDDHNGFIDDVIGWDFVNSKPLPYDRTGHGTLMAGIAAGAYNNGIDGAGVCPRCSLLPLKFLNYDGLGYTEDAIRAIEYAIQEKVSVILLAYAGPGYDEDLKEALEKARKANIVVVSSAGNDWENLDYSSTYPAKFQMPNKITVCASTDDDKLLETSNWGKRTVQIAAPGDEILGPVLFPEDQKNMDFFSGTSHAAAVTAGAIGLIRSQFPQIKAEDIVEGVLNSARRTHTMKGNSQTEGIIDLEKAFLLFNRHSRSDQKRHY